MDASSYELKLQQQIEQYRHVDDMHSLPEIFHYWSNTHLRPKLNSVLGVDSITEFYAEHLYRAASRHTGPHSFASLGAGDCAVEIKIAKSLRAKGLVNFSIECLELSPVLLERAQTTASAEQVTDNLRLVPIDLNQWTPKEKSYTGVFANHSLHHMVELEAIFSSTHAALRDDGVFVTNDMIGRNGHMRWPEALKLIEHIWAFLPDRFKYNHQLKRLDQVFVNRDCSTESFEGVRSQDILPLLTQKFEFSHFLGIGGLIDVFVDRDYGHNFDPKNDKDRALIDFINELNELTLTHGIIKPTMMFAVMTRGPTGRPQQFHKLSPKSAVRTP